MGGGGEILGWVAVLCLHSSLGWSVSFLYPKVRTRMVISALATPWGCPEANAQAF